MQMAEAFAQIAILETSVNAFEECTDGHRHSQHWVCVFEQGGYSDRRFVADEKIESAIFSELSLMAEQVLSASR